MILAAGRGSRLREVGRESPKCLISILGKSLLDHQIGALNYVGIEDIIVVGGHRSDLLGEGRYQLVLNEQWATTSMLESLSLGLRVPSTANGSVIVYGDCFLGRTSLEHLPRSFTDVSIGYTTNWLDNWSARYDDPLADLENFYRDELGQLTKIGGKALRLDDLNGQFAGVLAVSKRGEEILLGEIANGEANSTTEAISRLIQLGQIVGTFQILEPWFEIDTLRDLAYARSSLEGTES